MQYTESKQRNVSRHSDSRYRIQKRQPKHMSIVCETASTMRNGVIKISTTSVGEGSREHRLALGAASGKASLKSTICKREIKSARVLSKRGT